jgi:YebC/PmpR family DNA-binding regulatory protein
MSGHSKWATIKHKKGAADAKRGQAFSKVAKELTVVARNGGGDPEQNPTLRTLIAKAKSVNMPNDNVDRAIKKGTGELNDGNVLEEMGYEGYAAGGVAIVVKVLTDNKNRAAAEVRHIFSKNNSSLAQPGAVSRTFERKGQIFVDGSVTDEDTLMEVALGAGAEDMINEEGNFEILTDPTAFNDVIVALETANIATESAEVTMISSLMTPVTQVSQARSVMRFVSMLEDNEDVQDVYTNMDMDDAVIEALAAEDA